MADFQYNKIYKCLVTDKSDAIGMFAYALYKQQKIAFFEKTQSEHNRPPSEAELASFHMTSMLEPSINGYREQAEVLVSAFLTEALEQKIYQTQESVKDSVIIEHIGVIKDQLNHKRTLSGWLADVGGNLAVNFLTILIIGMVVYGYKEFSAINGKAEAAVGIANSADHRE